MIVMFFFIVIITKLQMNRRKNVLNSLKSFYYIVLILFKYRIETKIQGYYNG